MLLRSVFTKTLRDLRWPTFWTSFALFAIAAYFTLLYPTYSTMFDLQSILDKIPPAMKAIIGAQLVDVSSVTGFLNIELFPLILPAVLAGYAIAQGSGATAGEESRGTIDVLLSYPIPRWRVVAEKAVAITISVALIALGMGLGAIAGAAGSHSDIDSGKIAAGLLMASLLALDFGAIALVIASYSGNRSASVGVAAALLVVMYFVNALAPIISGLDAIKELSLFYWYLEGEPLRHGLAVGDSLVMAAVAVAGGLASLFLFSRRDLAA
jgi:beta-exotoxin I transport system permease protein